MIHLNLEKIVHEHRTPLLVIDHGRIRKNLKEFKNKLPKVQPYFAIKANSLPEIVKTLYNSGSSFDVASWAEFSLVLDIIKPLPPKKLQDFIWNKVIYANTMKQTETLNQLNPYSPMVTYDSIDEMKKIKKHCPKAGLVLRIEVPDEGSVVSLKDKFGIEIEKAQNLISRTIRAGLAVEGLSFHVGSQCANFRNYIDALDIALSIFNEAERRGFVIGETLSKRFPIKQLDIGGGFPVEYNGTEPKFSELAQILNSKLEKDFPEDKYAILAEPGRFLVANAGTSIMKIIGRTIKRGRVRYHVDDGLYHTYSGIIYDHQHPVIKALKKGDEKICDVFGPTCDSLDKISDNALLPENLKEGDILYAKNMGAYTNASSTGNEFKAGFNGLPPAKIIHLP
jgi:ornithine decarboxylase